MLWCPSDSPYPQLLSRGKDHFVEVCRLLVFLSCSASMNILFPPWSFSAEFLEVSQCCLTWLRKEKKEWRTGQESESGCDILSHMSSVTFSEKFHLFVFSHSEWGL